MSTTEMRRLKELADRAKAPPVPARTLALMLAATVPMIAVSMPLPWHHRIIPGGGFTVIHGIEGANWLLVVAAIAVALGLRFRSLPAGYYTKWLLTITAFLTVIGMFAEYIDTQTRAAQNHVDAYVGQGFFVGLAATALIVASTVVAWRSAESL
jgi:hypothetical protein